MLYLLSRRLRYCNEAIGSSLLLKEELADHAKRDVLTGLYNADWVENYFSRLKVNVSMGMEMPVLTVFVLNIDVFDSYSDNYGPAVADQVLRHVADTLTGGLRSSDKVARYGNDRFIVILPDTQREGAMLTAERLREAVKNNPVRHGAMSYPGPTISVAVATLQPDDELPGLLKVADETLYKAMEGGGDRVKTLER